VADHLVEMPVAQPGQPGVRGARAAPV
jgi:hypothetical protein